MCIAMSKKTEPVFHSTAKAHYKRFTRRKILFIFALVILIVLSIGISASIGTAGISFGEVYMAILHRFFPDMVKTTWLAETVVWHLRLTRIIMGILSGAVLGITGAVMQGVLKNSLADPYTLGISSGAAFGATLAIVGGIGVVGGGYLIIGNAFLFALLCSFIIIGLSSRAGAHPTTMILAGVACMYLFSATTTLFQYFGEADAVKSAIFWSVGDLSKATWDNISLVFYVSLVCIPIIIWKSWDLNALSAGDETATSLGVNVKRIRILLMIVSTLLVASVVCFTGTIGFIGLVAPHIVRFIIGGDNRFLLPASALVGSLILVLADTVARNLLSPTILPVGAITAVLGVPLFLYLVIRRRRDYF